MKRLALTLATAIFFVGVFFRSPDARADLPLAAEFGGRLGYATNPNSDVPNPLGVGFGARGGVELFKSLYLGGNIMYYLGTSKDTPLGATPSNTSVSTHTLLLGLEVGYSLHIKPLIIRPQLGFGDASLTSFTNFAGTVNNPATDVSNFTVTNQRFYLEPGLVALVNVGALYFGGDVNLLFIPDAEPSTGDAYSSFAFGGQLGIRL